MKTICLFLKRSRSACLVGLALGWTATRLVAVETPAPAARPSGELAGYKIVRLGRGHFNRLCLAADIDGTEGLMIVDTGAGATLLNKDKYKSLLPDATHPLPKGVPANVMVNGMSSPVGLARSFRVGGVDLGSSPVALVANRYLCDPQMLYESDSGRQYDGLLGENFLRHYHAIVDCGRMALYLNTDPAHAVHLGGALTRAGWTRVPMENERNDFSVPCTLNGHRFKLIVDTGAPFTDLDRDMMRRADLTALDTHMSGGLIGAHSERMGLRQIDSLYIGEFDSGRVLITAHSGLRRFVASEENKSSDAPLLGLLGGDFLARNNAMIDVGDHALYLKNSDPAGAASLH